MGAAAASVLVCLAAFAVRLLVSSLSLRECSSLLRVSLRISFLEVCGSRALQANPKKQRIMIIMIILQASGFVTADIDESLVKFSGEHGIVSSLPQGLEQASGRVVMSAEDFSKYEKLVAPPSKEERTKEREQLLWEKVQSRNRLREQETGHVEQIAKLEADVAKQRAMLQSVREQLEAVNDEVCDLRALVADPSVPTLNRHHSLRHVLLLRLRKTCLILLRLLIKTWKIVKMRKN